MRQGDLWLALHFHFHGFRILELPAKTAGLLPPPVDEAALLGLNRRLTLLAVDKPSPLDLLLDSPDDEADPTLINSLGLGDVLKRGIADDNGEPILLKFTPLPNDPTKL